MKQKIFPHSIELNSQAEHKLNDFRPDNLREEEKHRQDSFKTSLPFRKRETQRLWQEEGLDLLSDKQLKEESLANKIARFSKINLRRREQMKELEVEKKLQKMMETSSLTTPEEIFFESMEKDPKNGQFISLLETLDFTNADDYAEMKKCGFKDSEIDDLIKI